MGKRCGLMVLLSLALGAGPLCAQEWQRAGSPEPAQLPPAAPAKVEPRHVVKHAGPIRTASAPVAVRVPLPARKPDGREKTEKVVPEPPRAKPADSAISTVPPEERAKIRAALAWAGDLAAPPAGEDAFTAAIKNFQRRSNAKVTGELTPEQRASLVAAAQTHESDFGWNVVADPATGIRVGLPTKLIPRVQDAPHGTQWSSPHGEVQIETFRMHDPALRLVDVFDRQKSQPGRKIESSGLHDDSFVISGMQGLKYFSVRAQMRDGEIRGMTIMYDQAWEGILASVTGAIVSAYAPFPERAAPYATLRKPVEYGTGLIVSPGGYIVATRGLVEGCQVIIVPGLGDAESIAIDESEGLGLLRVYGRRKLSALSLATETARPGDVSLLGIPDPRDQNGDPRPREMSARVTGSGAIELGRSMPVAGLAGAAVLDGQRRLIGMMAMRGLALASIGPADSPVRIVSATAIREFLAAHDVPLAASPESDPQNSVVRVICVRK